MKLFILILASITIVVADVSHLFGNDGYNYERPQAIFPPPRQDSVIIEPPTLPETEYLPPISQPRPQPIPVPGPNIIAPVPSFPPPPPLPIYVSSTPAPIFYDIPSGPAQTPIEPIITAPIQAPEYLPPPPPAPPLEIQQPIRYPQQVQIQQPIRYPQQVQPIRTIQEQVQIPEQIQPIPVQYPVIRQQTQAIPLPRPIPEYLPPPQPAPILYRSQPAPFAIPNVTPGPAPRIVLPPQQPIIQNYIPPVQQQLIVPQPQSSGYNYDAPNTPFFA